LLLAKFLWVANKLGNKKIINFLFVSRAKRASARNFEIIDTIDENIIYLLHGKVDKNLFNMDYRYPMTLL